MAHALPLHIGLVLIFRMLPGGRHGAAVSGGRQDRDEESRSMRSLGRKIVLKRICGILVCLLLLSALIWPGGDLYAQRVKKPKKNSPILKETKSAKMIFRRIEMAWRGSDARFISDLVGSGKTYIVMGGSGPRNGYYSRSQVFYLLKKMFREYSQMKFEFVKYHNIDKPGKKVFAVAYRSYKNIRTDRVFQDKVYITLGKEGDDWVLTEIKTTR